MKYFKGVNKKGKKLQKKQKGKVKAEGSIPFVHTCTSVFNPGYEIDAWNGMEQLCTPIETDLFGTTDMYCWWPGQAPDTINNPEWNKDCVKAMKDWAKLKVIKPEW